MEENVTKLLLSELLHGTDDTFMLRFAELADVLTHTVDELILTHKFCPECLTDMLLGCVLAHYLFRTVVPEELNGIQVRDDALSKQRLADAVDYAQRLLDFDPAKNPPVH